MDRAFQVLAVLLAVAGAYFFWTGNKDRAFVSIVLGCVSFFLSVRTQVKERNRLREAEAEQNALQTQALSHVVEEEQPLSSNFSDSR